MEIQKSGLNGPLNWQRMGQIQRQGKFGLAGSAFLKS